jgi:cation-transporting ATPase 13A2
MVTGDNVLTAISVARQCRIIQQNQRVFLGDIDERTGRLLFRDFDLKHRSLHEETLMPIL